MADVNTQLAKYVLTLVEKQTGFHALKEMCSLEPKLLFNIEGLSLSMSYTQFFDLYGMYVVEKLHLALDQCGGHFELVLQRNLQNLSFQTLILYLNSAVKWISELCATPGLGKELFQSDASNLRHLFMEMLPDVDVSVKQAYSTFEYEAFCRKMIFWKKQLALDKVSIAS